MHDEGYVLLSQKTSTGETVDIIGQTAAGVFYGAQTLKQLIEPSASGPQIWAATIRDWPAMKYRGEHDDLSRGPFPTLAFQKHQLDVFAAHKVNLYSPYFESNLEYSADPLAAPPGGALTRDEAKELVAFATPLHIMIVPEQEAFGHVHHVLEYEKYADVAETPNGNVIAPGQPGSLPLIVSWFTQIAADFPSPFLHIGADETFDLGTGRTKPDVEKRGLGPVYADFLSSIHTALAPLHRRLIFWGDIGDSDPSAIPGIPKDMIAVPWIYWHKDSYDNDILPLRIRASRPGSRPATPTGARFTPSKKPRSIISPASSKPASAWAALAFSKPYGMTMARGSTTRIGLARSSAPPPAGSPARQMPRPTKHPSEKSSMATRAAASIRPWPRSWPPKTSSTSATTPSGSTPGAQPASPRQTSSAPTSPPRASMPSSAIELIQTALATDPSLREKDSLRAMELGARRIDFIGLKFQLSDEMRDLYAQAYAQQHDRKKDSATANLLDNISSMNGRCQDLRDGFSLLKNLYRESWLAENRPYWIDNVLVRYDLQTQLWQKRGEDINTLIDNFYTTRTLPQQPRLAFQRRLHHRNSGHCSGYARTTSIPRAVSSSWIDFGRSESVTRQWIADRGQMSAGLTCPIFLESATTITFFAFRINASDTAASSDSSVVIPRSKSNPVMLINALSRYTSRRKFKAGCPASAKVHAHASVPPVSIVLIAG